MLLFSSLSFFMKQRIDYNLCPLLEWLKILNPFSFQGSPYLPETQRCQEGTHKQPKCSLTLLMCSQDSKGWGGVGL